MHAWCWKLYGSCREVQVVHRLCRRVLSKRKTLPKMVHTTHGKTHPYHASVCFFWAVCDPFWIKICCVMEFQSGSHGDSKWLQCLMESSLLCWIHVATQCPIAPQLKKIYFFLYAYYHGFGVRNLSKCLTTFPFFMCGCPSFFMIYHFLLYGMKSRKINSCKP